MPVYVQTPTVTLPYPGLRPFRRDEFEIFFGREEHVAKLAEMLQEHHFVAVVGPSGCGKSSLVTAGLLPQLADGHVVDVEGPWYEPTIRPGDRPISRLAEALLDSGVLPDQTDEDLASRIGFLDATLRRGPLGLIEALDGAEPLTDGNLLIVVDQFEEIFRFRREESDQEADAFIALLLETVRQAEQQKLPIYVMLTMRSDYLGDCNQFSGLPEAISDSQFLTPRPNREQRHAAIVGPASMFGGEVEPALVNRLLNDMGDDPDQLPIMQHALMRMWSLKAVSANCDGDDTAPGTGVDEQEVVLTTDIYEDGGGWANTLSNHADEAFNGLGDDPALRHVAEMMFRSLTERGPDQHDVRRPVRVQEVADVADVATEVVKKVASVFRRSDRSFVTPGLADDDLTGEDLADDDILDISHESLIRQWGRLREWAQEEGDSAAIYRRLEDAARRWKAGKEAYLQSPGLDIGLKWRGDEQPTAAWARRYGTDFELSMRYLEESQAEKKRLDAEAEAQRIELAGEKARARQSRRNFWVVASLATLLALATTAAVSFAFIANGKRIQIEAKALELRFEKILAGAQREIAEKRSDELSVLQVLEREKSQELMRKQIKIAESEIMRSLVAKSQIQVMAETVKEAKKQKELAIKERDLATQKQLEAILVNAQLSASVKEANTQRSLAVQRRNEAIVKTAQAIARVEKAEKELEAIRNKAGDSSGSD